MPPLYNSFSTLESSPYLATAFAERPLINRIPMTYRLRSFSTLLLSWILSGLILGGASPSRAQVAWRAMADTSQLLIGDQTTLRLSLRHKATDEVSWPEAYDLGPGVEVVKVLKADTTITAQYRTIVQPITVTSFDSGRVTIAPVPIRIGAAGADSFDVHYTEPVPLEVHWVAISDTSEIRPIKPIYAEGRNWEDHAQLTLTILAILAAIGLIWWLVRKPARPVSEDTPPPPPLPPHVVALAALEELDRLRPWERGEAKAFQTQLSNILRAYVQGRYQVPALECTTPEIIGALAQQAVTSELQQQLQALLHTADMVKFAKAMPPTHTHHEALIQARAWVQRTQPIAPIDA